jgi:hypothetical protein
LLETTDFMSVVLQLQPRLTQQRSSRCARNHWVR